MANATKQATSYGPTRAYPKQALYISPVERNPSYGYPTNYVVANRGFVSMGSRGYKYWDYRTQRWMTVWRGTGVYR